MSTMAANSNIGQSIKMVPFLDIWWFDQGCLRSLLCHISTSTSKLLSASIEKWQPEMNTFHMPIGEMTIRLDDMGTILGIPLIDRSVWADLLSHDAAIDIVSSQLDVSPEDAHNELCSARGTSVRLEWLKGIFGEVSDADPEDSIRHVVRAYLLYILDSTLFADKTGMRVPIIYLQLLTDLDRVDTCAWGVAALAYLYRKLGLAMRVSIK